MKNSVPKNDPIAQQADTIQAGLCRGPVYFNSKRTKIIELITQGLQDKEIADKLCLSLSGVKWYLRDIYAQLSLHRPGGCFNRIDLAIWAVEQK
jgi:DNA-binding NarL/FixJ family response regulator